MCYTLMVASRILWVSGQEDDEAGHGIEPPLHSQQPPGGKEALLRQTDSMSARGAGAGDLVSQRDAGTDDGLLLPIRDTGEARQIEGDTWSLAGP